MSNPVRLLGVHLDSLITFKFFFLFKKTDSCFLQNNFIIYQLPHYMFCNLKMTARQFRRNRSD